MKTGNRCPSYLALPLTILCLCLIAGCTDTSTQPAAGLASDTTRDAIPDMIHGSLPSLVQGNHAFACDLYQRVSGSSGNLIFSPLSIRSALSMVYAGAGENTAAEMAQALHFPLEQSELNSDFHALLEELHDRNAPSCVTTLGEDDPTGISPRRTSNDLFAAYRGSLP